MLKMDEASYGAFKSQQKELDKLRHNVRELFGYCLFFIFISVALVVLLIVLGVS